MSQSDKIEAFWSWFTLNEPTIINAVEEESASDFIVENLDNLILALGAFSWEIGPGNKKTWCLTISPNENKDLLKISRSIMEIAPNLDKWEFNYFKPAKDWDRKFVVYDDLMNEHAVDAASWNYVALKYPDQMIELIIEADNISHLDQETALTAVSLVVMSELGEEVKISKIAALDVVSNLDDHHSSNRTSIEYLKNHILDF